MQKSRKPCTASTQGSLLKPPSNPCCCDYQAASVSPAPQETKRRKCQREESMPQVEPGDPLRHQGALIGSEPARGPTAIHRPKVSASATMTKCLLRQT